MEPVERRAIVRIDDMNPACQTFGAAPPAPSSRAGLLNANLEPELVALRAGALGEVECFGQHGAARLVAQGDHGGIVGAWAESVRVGEIEELAEQLRGLNTRRAACRERYVFRCAGHLRRAVAKAREFETRIDRARQFR